MSLIQQGLPPPYTDTSQATESSVTSNFLMLTTSSDITVNANFLNEQAEASEESQEINDGFKQSIYRHPLFPLLAMMFEKCETATAVPDTASHNFEKEVQAFMKHHETLKTPILGSDDEVNQLMIKAIQVLRIHLMEVEKVTELCKDFCSRYISCLKSKLTSETLLHVDGCDSPPPGELSSPGSTSNVLRVSPAMQVTNPVVTPTVVGGNMVLQQPQQQQPQIVSGNTVYQMVHTPQGIVAQPIQIQGPLTPINQQMPQVIHGSTPLSQIGLSIASPPHQQQQQQQTTTAVQQQLPQQTVPTQAGQADMKNLGKLNIMTDDADDDDKNSKQKRGVLPKQATQIMKSWLFQHIVHPYPTEDEKRQIASQTNLTLLQVNNWFINARRRILQPMLEASNPDKAKAKKLNKPTTKPQQRFWPVNLDSGSSSGGKGEEHLLEETAKPKQETSDQSPLPSVTTSDRGQPSAVTLDPTGLTQPDLMMGYMANGGLVLKVSPDGQLVPCSQTFSLPSAQSSFTFDTLQALQSSGLIFAPTPTGPLPLPLPLGTPTLPPTPAGFGLGLSPFSTIAGSPLSLGGLNFAPTAFSAPLQFANINAAPIDLSTVSNTAPLQLSTVSSAHAANQFNAQMLMGMSMSGTEGDRDETDETEREAGELHIDTKDVKDILEVGNG